MADLEPGTFVNLDTGLFMETRLKIRSQDPDEFRRTELNWLAENNLPAHTAITDFFSRSEQKERSEPSHDEIALPGRQGALLGSAVVRRMAERGTVDYSNVVKNWTAFIATRQLVYKDKLTTDELTSMYGHDTARAFGLMVNDVSRTMCAVVVGRSLMELGDGTAVPMLSRPIRGRAPRGGRLQSGARGAR
jgi:hypothetical protein